MLIPMTMLDDDSNANNNDDDDATAWLYRLSLPFGQIIQKVLENKVQTWKHQCLP